MFEPNYANNIQNNGLEVKKKIVTYSLLTNFINYEKTNIKRCRISNPF